MKIKIMIEESVLKDDLSSIGLLCNKKLKNEFKEWMENDFWEWYKDNLKTFLIEKSHVKNKLD